MNFENSFDSIRLDTRSSLTRYARQMKINYFRSVNAYEMVEATNEANKLRRLHGCHTRPFDRIEPNTIMNNFVE